MILTYDGAAPSITFVAQSSNLTTSTTHTHTISFGTARGDRIIIVTVVSGGSGVYLSSVTIGGVSAALQTREINQLPTEIWTARVPSGSSGNVVITKSISMNRSSVALYAAYGLKSPTATATSTDATGVIDTSVDIQSRGIVIATADTNSGAQPGTPVWAGATRDHSSIITTALHTSASYQATGAEIGHAVQCSGLGGFQCGCTASFR